MELFTLLGMIADKLRFDGHWMDDRISLCDTNGIDDGMSIYITLYKDETEKYIKPLLDEPLLLFIEPLLLLDDECCQPDSIIDTYDYSILILEHGKNGYEIEKVIFHKEEYKETTKNGCKITEHITTEEPHELKETIYKTYTGDATLSAYHNLCNSLAAIMCEGDEMAYCS